MSNVDLIASPQPLPEVVTLCDPDINDGKPFEYGPGKSRHFRAILIETGYNGKCSYEYDVIVDLPKVLPKHIYFYEGSCGVFDTQPSFFQKEMESELKKFKAYAKHIVNTMGEFCMINLSVPVQMYCAENVPSVIMCIDDLDIYGSAFMFGPAPIRRFVSREKAPFPVFQKKPIRGFKCCVSLLACHEKISEEFIENHGRVYPNGATYYNLMDASILLKLTDDDFSCRTYLGGLSDLPSILPSNIYLSGLNPSFYPFGNKCDRKERKDVVKNLVKYLQDLADMQSEVWYIRQWLPNNVAKADTVEIRTMKVSDLDISGEEFEFELCVLYHFVK